MLPEVLSCRYSADRFRICAPGSINGSLVPTLTERYRHQLGRAAPPAEVRSWQCSLDALSADLVEVGLEAAEVLVEYRLPLTSKRADVVLCGQHPKTAAPHFVVVELKQWTRAHMLEDASDICVLDGMGERLHPVEQVRRYCWYLQDFAAAFSETPAAVTGVAYLHNATDLDVDDLLQYPQDEQGRLFTGQRRSEFLAYLRQQLAPDGGAEVADLLLGSCRTAKQTTTRSGRRRSSTTPAIRPA